MYVAAANMMKCSTLSECVGRLDPTVGWKPNTAIGIKKAKSDTAMACKSRQTRQLSCIRTREVKLSRDVQVANEHLGTLESDDSQRRQLVYVYATRVRAPVSHSEVTAASERSLAAALLK